jgi:hypothetical protein
MLRDIAHQTFANVQYGFIDGILVQPLGRGQDQSLGTAAEIDRTHSGIHTGGNQGDNFIETCLIIAAVGHELAQASQ